MQKQPTRAENRSSVPFQFGIVCNDTVDNDGLYLWQRNDIALAITKYDQFDFLIDIVPRDELKPQKRQVRDASSVLDAYPVRQILNIARPPALPLWIPELQFRLFLSLVGLSLNLYA